MQSGFAMTQFWNETPLAMMRSMAGVETYLQP